MDHKHFQKRKETTANTKLRGPLSEPGKHFPENWLKGGPISKQELLILILSGLVLLIMILVGIIAITSDLLDGMDADQGVIRNGMEQRLAWYGETSNLTDDQQTGTGPISDDGHDQFLGLRQQDTQNKGIYMDICGQVQRGVNVYRCPLPAQRNQTAND